MLPTQEQQQGHTTAYGGGTASRQGDGGARVSAHDQRHSRDSQPNWCPRSRHTAAYTVVVDGLSFDCFLGAAATS